MTTVLLVISIWSFLLGIFYILIDDDLTFKSFVLKTIYLIVIIIPVIYWLYLLNILK